MEWQLWPLLLFMISRPVAVQPQCGNANGELADVVTLLENVVSLLQGIGVVLAVVGLSAGGIAFMLHEPRMAKSIAKSTIVGVIILLTAGAAVAFVTQPLC
jgi:hypothetical protein